MTSTIGNKFRDFGHFVKGETRKEGEKSEQQSAEATTSCPQCSQENRGGARFCSACGAPLPVRAALVLTGCAQTKQPYVLRFEYQRHGTCEGWFAIEAKIVSTEVVNRGGYGAFRVKGSVFVGAACPYCGAKSFFPVHEKFTCWDGEHEHAPCAWCQETHYLHGPMQGIDCAMTDI